jgi:hypothetical protein
LETTTSLNGCATPWARALAGDPRFKGNSDRLKRIEELLSILRECFLTKGIRSHDPFIAASVAWTVGADGRFPVLALRASRDAP